MLYMVAWWFKTLHFLNMLNMFECCFLFTLSSNMLNMFILSKGLVEIYTREVVRNGDLKNRNGDFTMMHRSLMGRNIMGI